MSKYKVGDTVKVVRMTGPNAEGRKHYIGETFTIKKLNPNGSHLDEHYSVEGECPYIFFVDELEHYMKEQKVFTKSDLKPGYVVKYRDGSLRMVIQVKDRSEYGLVHHSSGWHSLSCYTDDLVDRDNNPELDICAVYGYCAIGTDCLKADTEGRPILWERVKKLLYNGKVVCIDNVNNTGNYTVGKIYQFVEGKLTTDGGSKLPYLDTNKIYSFDDWDNFTNSKFIEIKE